MTIRHSTLLLCILALLATAAPAQDAKPLFPGTGAWGVVVHTPYRAEALKALGVQWVRVSIRWKNVEKETRGAYDWNEADKLLNYYLDHGFHVMTVVTVENLCPLYEADKEDHEAVIAAIERWAGALAARFKGSGILWELGNEPECFPMGGYWNNPQTYARMARRAALAIKTADPGARVAALSVAWMDRGFVSKALNAGLLDDGNIDILTYHGYHRRGMMPESGLAEDVQWLREQAWKRAPSGKHVIVVDSERGYAMVPFLEAKSWSSWRNLTYSEQEQAAYLARHYLETIGLGVEIAVWYKDMSGEDAFSLYYGSDEDPRGLRPMGHVYRNLAALLPGNPKEMKNTTYAVSLVDPPDDIAAPDGALSVRTFLRSYVTPQQQNGHRLVVAVWHPVEAFDGRILESRKRIGDKYYEAWRAVSPEDRVTIPTQVRIAGLPVERVESMYECNLLAPAEEDALARVQPEAEQGCVLSPSLEVGPLPTVLVVDVK